MSPIAYDTTPVIFKKNQLAETALLALDDLYPDGWNLIVTDFRLTEGDFVKPTPSLEVAVVAK